METVVNESSLFENIFNELAYPVLIFEIVNDGLNEYRLLEVNEAACSLLKYSKEELMKKEVLTLFKYITPKVRRSVKELLYKDGSLSTVLHLPAQNDLMISVEVDASLMTIGSKKLIFCMLKEHSIPRCHHDAREEENNYLRTIMDTIQSFVVILDKDGRIYNWNHYTEQISGYSWRKCI